ncbi:hypothetical protein Anas_05577 [Armadillidium nasatum]|uniref:Uncharacterized protein n=1 Tax=Armadillidium nasatum TaxID=96803 RepID=A0A5N5SX70_9CRUS|nr:hypothetical protein Anas_05577 [Armadillidium nasatum]
MNKKIFITMFKTFIFVVCLALLSGSSGAPSFIKPVPSTSASPKEASSTTLSAAKSGMPPEVAAFVRSLIAANQAPTI